MKAHILFLIDRYFPTDHGFIEEVYSKHLPQIGFPVTIVARSKQVNSVTFGSWNKAGLILFPSRTKYFSDLWMLKRLHSLMACSRFDIVQVRNDPIFALLAPADKFAFQLSHLKAEQFLTSGKKNVSSRLKALADLIFRWIYLPKARLSFYVSETMERYIRQRYRIKKSGVLPLGVFDVQLDCNEIKRLRNQYGLEGKTSYIYIGTLASDRKLSVVIDAFKNAEKQARSSLALLFVGDAPDPADVRALEKKVQFEGVPNVYFIDRVPRKEVANYIAACDVGLSTIPNNKVFHCSSPTKTLEYLNVGIPVIATRIPDQMEVVLKSGSGRLCQFTADDISNKMLSFHSERGLKELGKRGQQFVRATRNYNFIAQAVAAYYEDIFGRQ